MADPKVPAEEQIGHPEGVHPAKTSDEDDTPAQEAEEAELEELIDPDDVGDPDIEA